MLLYYFHSTLPSVVSKTMCVYVLKHNILQKLFTYITDNETTTTTITLRIMINLAKRKNKKRKKRKRTNKLYKLKSLLNVI